MRLHIESKVMNLAYDVSELVSSVNISFDQSSTASKMDFTLIKDNTVVFHEGDCVLFYDGDLPVFKGYVFSKTSNEKKEIKSVCYDQLRYLKAKDSFQVSGESLRDIIDIIAKKFQLIVGEVEDVGYTAANHYHENESLLDVITYHIQQARLLTGKQLVFFDDFGQLSVKSADRLLSKFVIGIESLAGSYSYKTDIDSETYNFIKLVKPNKATGKDDVPPKQDIEKIKRWGMLQYFEVVDENWNDAQILDQLKLLFDYHNKVFRSLSVDALGVPGLRGGSTVYVFFPDIGDISVDKYLFVDKVTHSYSGSSHTMKLDMVVR